MSDGITLLEAHRRLEALADDGDWEINHQAADEVLLKCIEGHNASVGKKIREAFDEIDKWYA